MIKERPRCRKNINKIIGKYVDEEDFRKIRLVDIVYPDIEDTKIAVSNGIKAQAIKMLYEDLKKKRRRYK